MKNKIPPLPAHGQDIAAKHLAPWVHVFIFTVVVLTSLSFLAYACYRFEVKLREDQTKSEQKAVREHHAIDIQP